MLDTSIVTNWKFEETKLLGCGNFGIVRKTTEWNWMIFLLPYVQVFKGHCQDTGRELAVKIVRDLNDKVHS